MSDVDVSKRDSSIEDEIMITDLTCKYFTVWHSESNNATMIDMHIKRKEAKALYEALQEIFRIQTKEQKGNKSLHKTTSP